MILTLPLGILVVLIESYLLGSIPFGVIVGRVGYGKDPREGGSGSIGMTNMNRLFGVKAAAITFVGDVAKGALAVAVARLLLPHIAVDALWEVDLVLIVAAMGSIFGHVFCPWLKFKGGKGISTGLGSLLVGFPLVAVTILAVFLVVAFLTKRISAGSIAAAIAFPVFSCVYHWGSWPFIVVALVVGAAVVIAHRGNIKRMMQGTEPTFSFNTGKDKEGGEDD